MIVTDDDDTVEAAFLESHKGLMSDDLSHASAFSER